MLILFSLMLFIPISVSLFYSDGNLETFLNSLAITLFFGLILYLLNIKSRSDIKTKEGFLIVVLFFYSPFQWRWRVSVLNSACLSHALL